MLVLLIMFCWCKHFNAVYVDDECKMAWKRLREKYRHEKDKLNSSRSGDAARHETTWYLFPVMGFIEPCQQPRE